MPQSLEVLVDVRRLQLNLCRSMSSRPVVNRKLQRQQVKRQAMHVSRKINEFQPLRFRSQTKYLVRRFRSFQ